MVINFQSNNKLAPNLIRQKRNVSDYKKEMKNVFKGQFNKSKEWHERRRINWELLQKATMT